MKLDRRQFFKISALGGAAASLDACSTVVPTPMRRRLVGPERRAVTACGACSAACGLAARVVGDNVVQLEGVPDHPVNAGAVCPRGVAEIQSLYHPERVRGPGERGADGNFSSTSWDRALDRAAEQLRATGGVVGLGECTVAERAIAERIAVKLGATIVSARPPFSEPPVDAMRAMLGSAAYSYDIAHADYVLTLGADWLQASASPVETQRAFAALRRRADRGRMVTVGPRLSVTAAKSDQWIPARSDQLATFAMAVMHQLLARGLERSQGDWPGRAEVDAVARDERFSPAAVAKSLGLDGSVIERVALDLAGHRRAVVVTDRRDRDTQWASVALNLLIGSVGREGGLVEHASPALPSQLGGSVARSAREFPRGLRDAAVLLVRANPIYATPASSGWREGLEHAAFVANVSSFLDESAKSSHVLLAASSSLESPQLNWGSTLDGTGFASAGPAVVPALYDTLPTTEILLRLAHRLDVGLPWQSADEYLAAVAEPIEAADALVNGGFATFQSAGPELEQSPEQETPVADEQNVAEAPSTKARSVELGGPNHGRLLYGATPRGALAVGGSAEDADDFPLALEVHEPMAFRGGLGAHLPYLHGLTDGVEREVWRTVVEMHPSAARAAGVSDGTRVAVRSRVGVIEAVARVRNGIRPDTVAVAIGLGRRALGYFSEGYGANPLELVDDASATFVRVEKLV